MDPLIDNPFSTVPGRAKSPYDDESVMGGDARGLVRDFQRADMAEARSDPLAEAQKVLTGRKTQIGYAKQAAEQLRDTFLDTEGSDLFERDPSTNKALKNPDGSYVPRMGAEIDSLRSRSQEKVGLIQGALTPAVRGESTEAAQEAARQLAEKEPLYKAKLDKWTRIQDQLSRIQTASDETELQLGQYAAARLSRDGVLMPPAAPAAAQPVSPQQGSSVRSEQGAHNSHVVGSNPTPAPIPGQAAPPPGQPPVGPAPVSPVTPPAGPTPLALVQLHKQIKDNEAVMAMDTTSPELSEALRQKNDRINDMFMKGMGALPSDGLRQRVIDITRDPTLGEKVKNFGANVAEGAGSAIVDMGEFFARNAKYAPNLILPGVTALTPDAVKQKQQEGEAKVAEFAQAMRDEAATWGLKGVPKEVAEKLNETFSGMLGQGLGSTAAFLAPTTGALRIGQLLGATPKVLKAIAVAVPGLAGGAAEGNSLRREAAINLEQMVKAGELTAEEAAKGENQAEFIGVLAGLTESASPLGRWSKQIAGLPIGQTLLKQMADKFGGGGIQALSKWLRGNGRRLLVEVAEQGAEEAFQELGQSYIENRAARGDFGNVAFDPQRELGEGLAESAGVGGITGALVTAVLGGFSGADVKRQKRIAAAMKRGAETGQAKAAAAAPAAAPASPTTPPATLPPPVVSPTGQTVQQWTFTNKGGEQATVNGTGLKDAISKLPKDFKPDLTKTPTQQTVAAAADQATPGDLKGEQIDKDWTNFSPESNSLGIPRVEMPQIKAEARGALTQFLAARGVTHTEEEVLPGSLRPTQAEYSQAKVDKARGFEGGDRAILVSADGHVVDGHHQWLAKLNDEPNTPMRVIRLNAPIKELLAQVNEFPSVKAAAGATKPPGDTRRNDPATPGGTISQPAETAPGQGSSASTNNPQAPAKPAGKPSPIQKRAAAVYAGILAKFPKTTNKLWRETNEIQSANPDRFHPVREDENPKGLKIGDEVVAAPSKRRPQDGPMRGIVVGVEATKATNYGGGYSVRIAIPEEGKYGGHVGIDRVEKLTQGPESGAGSAPDIGAGVETPLAPAPVIKRGTNTPAASLDVVTKASGIKAGERAHKFMSGFLGTLGKANKKAFADMEVHVISQAQWDAHPAVGQNTPDSAGAYDADTNTLYINSDKNKGEAVVNTIVHEAGHFAERFYLGEKFTQGEWESLYDSQREAAARQYNSEDTRDGSDLITDRRARQEWVAMQFARVVRGDTEGMSKGLKSRLENFLKEVRALVSKWVGNEDSTTEALDAKILEMLGRTEEKTSGRPGGATVTAPSGESPAAPAPTDPEPPKPSAPTTREAARRAKAKDAFAGLLGTPAESGQQGVPTDRIAKFVELAQSYISDGIATPEAMAAELDATFAKKARKYSQALWNAFGMVNPALSSQPDWNGVYAGIDNSAEKAEISPREPSPVSPETQNAGPSAVESRPEGTGDRRELGEQQPQPGEGVGRDGGTPAESEGSDRPGGERAGDGEAERSDALGGARNLRGVRRAGTESLEVSPQNYQITEADDIGSGGLAVKYRDNIKAIELLKHITSEHRRATRQEQAVLVRYVGWGGLKGVFDPKNIQWARQFTELEALLNTEEYDAARASVLNAHYTSPTVIQRGIYAALKRFGFKGGAMIEGGVGTGHFIGLMPAEMRGSSSYVGVERDPLTAKIAALLYPQAKIYNLGFEETNLTRGQFDASAGNPPFGDTKLFDKYFPAAAKHSIHNYFILKQLELLRPGGVAGFVVSHYFMDAVKPGAREALSKKAEFLGAIRLPNTAFKQNANTEVTTDLVFFRKLAEGETAKNKDWLKTEEWNDPKSGGAIAVNKWLLSHPDMMLGDLSAEGTMHAGRVELTLQPRAGQDLGADLDAAVKKLPRNVYQQADPAVVKRLTAPEKAEIPEHAKVGGLFIDKNGQVRRRLPDENMEQREEIIPDLIEGTAARIKAMIPVRDALNQLVRAELADDTREKELVTLRDNLNKRYDDFVKKFGYLNQQANRRAFFDDPESSRILGLEKDYDAGVSPLVAKKNGVAPKASSAKKASIFSNRVNRPYTEVTSVETPKEALMVSLNQRGEVDLPHMADLTGMQPKVILEALKDLIFNTPRGNYESKEQYLSGNVREKLAEAQQALEQTKDPQWQHNIDALKAVIPADINPADIAVPVGAPWVPASDVSQFARDLVGSAPSVVLYRKQDGGWLFTHDDTGSTAATEKYGTNRASFGEIFKDILNGRPTLIYDRDSDEKRVLNQEQTALAGVKAEEIRTQWEEWIWKDQSRRDRLHRFYNDTFNNYVDPKYDGSHLTLPGVNTNITLLQHQKNVAWRTITDRIALYDHVVGAGKTFAGIASFMEMRRLGRVRKPLFVVPNHITNQWRDSFIELYPNANVLTATPADFEKANRQKLFAKVLTGEYDAVIIGHSQFKKIGVSPDVERSLLNEMIDEITESIEAMKAAEGKRRTRAVAQAEKTKERLTAKVKALAEVGKRDDVATFEELGIDGLFVDEAHEFKNLFYTTQMQRVSGLGDPSGSQRAFDLFLKSRYLRQQFGGKAPMVFATGTPISNSLVEMFTMQRYLQGPILEQMGLRTLDAWAKVFGNVKHVYEVDPTGTGYRMATRLAQFQNVGELSSIYRSVADVITMTDLQAQAEMEGKRFPVPKVKGGKPQNIVAERTKEQEAYFGVEVPELDEAGNQKFDGQGNPITNYPKGTILWRVDNMPTDPSIDNMLKLTSDARKAGLDMRLINPSHPDRPESKVNKAVAEIARIHRQWEEKKGTQLVFCDLSVPASARGQATAKAKEQASEFYFTRNATTGKITAVPGAATVELKSAPEYQFFVSKNENGVWAVTERTSGFKVAGGNTKAEAVGQAEKLVERYRDNFVKKVGESVAPLEEVTAARDEWMAAQQETAEPKEGEETGAEQEGEPGVSMDELLADQSSFSVYDDMKAKLIAAGVPEYEIAFIHDYKTPLAKQKLFAAVNSGKIRVLFGSTPKMGAGTNVQKKLVALHHIDAPWRPSDLEQRDGRGVRQGNEFYTESFAEYKDAPEGQGKAYEADPKSFAIELMRYSTKQTYDTRMWQLLEHKARGIEGFRKADRNTRVIEDVSGETANASDMKAAASGDPLIQREIEERNARTKLELVKRAWDRNRYEVQNQAKWLADAPIRHKSIVDGTNALIAARTEKPDPFNFEKADGAKMEKKDGLAKVVAAAITEAENRGDKKSIIGKYRGYTFGVRMSTTWKNETVAEIQALHDNLPKSLLVTEYTKDDTLSDAGFAQRLDNWLDGFEAKIADADVDLEKSKVKLDELQEEINRGFPKEQELVAIRTQHEATRQELLNKKKKPAAPAAESKPLGTPPVSEVAPAAPMVTENSPARIESLIPEASAAGWNEALSVYAAKGAGALEGRTRGIDRVSRPQQGLKLWEDMTQAERVAEFRQAAIADYRVAAAEATDPTDYLLNRALDPLDPMSGFYKMVLQRAGAEVNGGRIRVTPHTRALIDGRSRGGLLGTPAVKGTPDQEKILAKVTGTLEDNRTFGQKITDYLADLGDYLQREFQQKLLDRFTAIKRLERATIGTNELDASISAYKWSRLTSNLAGVMEFLMKHGQIAYRNGSMVIQPGTKGLVDILRPVVDGGKLRLWEGYVAAYRANNLLAEGKEKNFGKFFNTTTGEWEWDQVRAQAEIDELLSLGSKYPEFEQVRREYVDFQKSVLDMATAAGLIDPMKRAMWERSDYVPFYRIVEALDRGDTTKGPTRRRGFSGQRSGIRKLKGGPQQVAILENIFRNIEQLVDASFKNIAMQRIADLADNNNDLMVKIPYKAVPFKTSFDETVEALERAGVDTSGLTKPELEEVVTFWRMRAPEGKDIVSAMNQGKPVYYRVKDKPLLRSILAMGPDRHSWWMKLLMVPKRGLTTLVTLDPAFMAANTIRDSFSAWVIADTPIKPGWDAMRGFAKSLANDPVKLAIMANGGGTGHYNTVQEGEVRASFLRMTREQQTGFLDSIIDTPAKLFRLYRDIGRASENANRIAIAESASDRGASPAEAAFQALDIMDFGLRGDSKALAFFLDTVPFMNARIQGLYRLGRGLMNDPKRVATHGAMILGATLALLASNWDDDRYWELPEWERDLYYHLWIAGRHVRIPKPFEVGQIFSTIPERFMQFMAKDGDSKVFARRMLSMIADTFAMNPIPQAIKPLAERAMNLNMLTGGRIISRGDEFKTPEQQFNAYTSALAREMAAAAPDNAPEWLRSPKSLDFLIRGYTGSLGMYAVDAADAVIRMASNYPSKPAAKPGDYWLVRRFSPESDLRENKFVAEFYELNGDIAQIEARVKALRDSGELQQASQVVQENRAALSYAPVTESTNKAMSALRRRERQIHEDRNKTPEQKREELERLARQKNRLAEQAVKRAPGRPTPIYNPFQ